MPLAPVDEGCEVDALDYRGLLAIWYDPYTYGNAVNLTLTNEEAYTVEVQWMDASGNAQKIRNLRPG